ncbi:MAG TPA: hypothetical protein VH436_18785 [Vicinamibacterales bacterium]
MKRLPIVSREYKVMLRAAKFTGAEPMLLAAAAAFWSDFSRAIEEHIIDITGSLRAITKRRRIQFLDTPSADLTAAGYIVRVRRNVEDGRPEVTLKFRHEDRYLSESRRIRTRVPNGDLKFEEDVKGPFVSMYSHSATVGIGKRQAPADLRMLVKIFPSLSRRLVDEKARVPLAAIGGFTARELVITGTTFQIGRGPKVVAECALIVWYDDEKISRGPQAVEFSYRYGSRKEQYGGGPARRAFAIFKALQSLDAWVDPHPRTKTRFVLDKQK